MKHPTELTSDDLEMDGLADDAAFNAALDAWGELHVETENHGSYHVHRHDTVAVGDTVYIDSKHGDWDFPLDGIEVDYPHSHKEE